MKIIASLFWTVGFLLMFGGVGYMEQGGSCLVGTLESLIGLGLMWLTSRLIPAPQPARIYRVGEYTFYDPTCR